MRHALWSDASVAEHATDIQAILSGEWSNIYPYVILVVTVEDDELSGFAEVTLRSRADGCNPSQPVGYLEGWYVAESERRRSVAGCS
jgi:aminoglycoside 6'-N-acetyltransferase I